MWACLENAQAVCGPTTKTINVTLPNPTSYHDYRDLTDTVVHTVTGGQKITIGAVPIMLEQ